MAANSGEYSTTRVAYDVSAWQFSPKSFFTSLDKFAILANDFSVNVWVIYIVVCVVRGNRIGKDENETNIHENILRN